MTDLIGGWTAEPDAFELYADDTAGEAHLLRANDSEPSEQVATFFHSSGVTRATIWRGTASNESNLWREAQRAKSAALIAARHAGRP
ncbi:hypothetical protein [Glycomyces sp. NPDC048151]|uniref:hypothetical protein n=1 Tax=Glycomyces sp. NPDC048151 TaxID=3364002 RepID=UPI00371EE875